MKIIDLHTHSYYSDGTLSPRELVLLAAEAGLSAIALTDHDTASGLKEAEDEGKPAGVEIIPGIEFAGEYKDEEIHILGYFIDYEGQYFKSALEGFKNIRDDRNARLVKRLNSLNMRIPEKDLDTGGKTLTRLHFAKALAKNGYAKSVDAAFEKHLNHGCPAYVGRNAPGFEECIETVKKSGGIAVLAHPYSYKRTGGNVISMVTEMAKAGLGGIEAVYPSHTPAQERALRKAASCLGITITGGSDFHGANRPAVKIGTGKDNIRVEYGILEELKKANGKNTIV